MHLHDFCVILKSKPLIQQSIHPSFCGMTVSFIHINSLHLPVLFCYFRTPNGRINLNRHLDSFADITSMNSYNNNRPQKAVFVDGLYLLLFFEFQIVEVYLSAGR